MDNDNTTSPSPEGPIFLPKNFSLNYLEELQLLHTLELSRKTLSRRVCPFAHLVSIPRLALPNGKSGFACFLSQCLETPVAIPNSDDEVTHCIWEIMEEIDRPNIDVEIEYTTYDFRIFYDQILEREKLPPCTLTNEEFDQRLLQEREGYSMEFVGSLCNDCACVILYREDAIYVANLRESCSVMSLIEEHGTLSHKFLTATGKVVMRHLTNILHKYPYPEEKTSESKEN